MIGILSSNPSVAYLLGSILERGGHVAVAATNRRAAADLCQLRPDILVVDAIARDTCWDGVVSDAIRELHVPPGLIVLAAWSESTVTTAGVEVLSFPFHADEVTAALERLLRSRSAA